MEFPDDRRYSALHAWARREPDGSVTVGITDHAQSQLGDVVFVQLPDPGRHVTADEAVGVIESVKSASDLHTPLAGKVLARNEAASADPESVNRDPHGTWLIRLQPDAPAAWEALLDAARYRTLVQAP